MIAAASMVASGRSTQGINKYSEPLKLLLAALTGAFCVGALWFSMDEGCAQRILMRPAFKQVGPAAAGCPPPLAQPALRAWSGRNNQQPAPYAQSVQQEQPKLEVGAYEPRRHYDKDLQMRWVLVWCAHCAVLGQLQHLH